LADDLKPNPDQAQGSGIGLSLIDRYLLRLTGGPMLGCLAVTLVALLLERALRLLDLLSQSSDRFGYVVQLTGQLAPHYLGLALPVAFFVALFIVIARLSDGSEIDALLASGVSLTRLAVPFVALGLVLTFLSLIVFGYLQPYSRYAYRAVMHAAATAGWNGELHAGAFVTEDRMIMTADQADPAGRRLEGMFIRRLTPDGREEVITARTADLRVGPDGKTVTLTLRDGRRILETGRGGFDTLQFDSFATNAPLAGSSALLRARGGDERELTLGELAARARSNDGFLPRSTLLAELYGRLARAAFLPFLPLIAFPLGLAAKRGRRAPGLILAGLLLLAFQHSLQLGQSLAEAGRVPPFLAIWTPFVLFTGFGVWMFAGSRNRPGETPITLFFSNCFDVAGRCRNLVMGKPVKATAS
jgi:lipopolysaccharide export system permease protein